jgi:multiple sugar transport system substrate-binding protein
MAHCTLRLALISGGMYDHLYARIPDYERSAGVKVEIAFRGTHPELNAHLAGLETPPYDLISTHTKYAPSQRRFLAPLEGFDTADFFAPLLDLATIEGALYGIPRNIDLRLLHYRTVLLDVPPATWEELVTEALRLTHAPDRYGFAFPGMESGLFGTFFELAECAGARVFPESLVPQVNNEAGAWALDVLRRLIAGGGAPTAVAGWHYDEVHQYFRQGCAAMVADWPGYYASYKDAGSAVRDRFRVAPMPAGPTGRVCCYSGSHTFALTHRGGHNDSARELLRFLTAPEQQQLEARQGSVAVRRSVMQALQGAASGDDAERLALLGRSIELHLIIPPKLSYYPRIEEILWRVVQAAMLGEVAISTALREIEERIAKCVVHAA